MGLRRAALRRVCPGQARRSSGAFPDHVGCRTLAADQSLVAIGMHYTCMNLLGQGKLDEAIKIGEEGVAMCRQVRNLFIRGTILNSLAEARRQRRELADAQTLIREGIECKREIDWASSLSSRRSPGSLPTEAMICVRRRSLDAPRPCVTRLRYRSWGRSSPSTKPAKAAQMRAWVRPRSRRPSTVASGCRLPRRSTTR